MWQAAAGGNGKDRSLPRKTEKNKLIEPVKAGGATAAQAAAGAAGVFLRLSENPPLYFR